MDLKDLLTIYAKDERTQVADFGDRKGLRKFFECEAKAVDGEDRVIEFVGSDETVDRSGDVVAVDGWDLEQFKKNPVILFGHRYGEPPVGKATQVWQEGGALRFKVKFASAEEYPFADTVYRLVKGGFIKATSVGFIPKAWEDYQGEQGDEKGMKPRRRYTKQELLELSVVSVPANPNALIAPKAVAEAVAKGVLTQAEAEAIEKDLVKKDEAPAPATSEDPMAKALGEVKGLLAEFKSGQDEMLKLLRDLLDCGGTTGKGTEAPGASPNGTSNGLYDGLLTTAKKFEETVGKIAGTNTKGGN